MAPVVTMRQLLESGVHFGHQTRRWNPKMKRFILAERNGIYIIDLQQSLDFIDTAYEFIKETVAHGGSILYVGTKKQAQEAVAEQARRVGMPFVNQRWLGGMLTNFSTVFKRLQRLKELEEIDFDDVAGSGMTKKELLHLRRERDKLERSLGGIRDMSRVPSAIWVVDTKKEHIAVSEARKLGIPVIAILDTNCDPDEVTYPIPGNDDAIRSVSLLTRVVADAVADGLIARAGAADGEAKPAPAGSGEIGAEEPLAEWELQVLEGKTASDEAAAQASANGRVGQRDQPRGRGRAAGGRAADRAGGRADRSRAGRGRAGGRAVGSRRAGGRAAGSRGAGGRAAGGRGGRRSGRQQPSRAGWRLIQAGARPAVRSAVASASGSAHYEDRQRDEDMANFTAADVKRLREQTAAGMLDCKKALEEADGDFDAAVEILRLKGAKDVSKRASRTAGNGLVTAELAGTEAGVLVELNCETDFVAKTELFQDVAAQIAKAALEHRTPDRLTLLGLEARPGATVQQLIEEASASLKEKLELGRYTLFEGGYVATYLHKSDPALPPTVGVLVQLDKPSRRSGQGRGAPGGRDAAAVPDPGRGARQRGRARARHHGADHPGRGQAGAGRAQDRRGPAEQFLQGHRAHRAAVRARAEEDDQAAAQRAGRHRAGLRPVPGGPGRMTAAEDNVRPAAA